MPSKAEHRPTGAVCDRCGLPSSAHRPSRSAYYKAYESVRERASCQDRIIGIDGEGKGRDPHRYIYLAAADEHGQEWSVSAEYSQNTSGVETSRLTTEQCLDFILSLPDRSLIFGYAFLYDLTKILTDVDDIKLYLLVHEKRRQRLTPEGRIVYRPVQWRDYELNFVNRRFTVSRGKWVIGPNGRYWKGKRRTVWDVFRFFQGKFTSALLDWEIASKERLACMQRMKELRDQFDKMSDAEVQAYCLEECNFLSKLGRRLLTAHKQAGLPLKSFFGAGSTGGAFLDKLGIKDKRGVQPEEMRLPVAASFFGGHFENSVIGPIRRPVKIWDISSAYPYQAYLLPCLEHGTWSHCREPTLRDIQGATLACIHWRILRIQQGAAWGPLPVRASDGTTAYPLGARGGWTWKKEYLAARKLNPHVEATEAWLYHTDCDCRPFGDVAQYYRERIKLGKDARGKVLKLGLNSGCYGKIAQSIGINPPYQSWVWAGNVTSGCRAQLLEAIYLASDRWGVLMLATDSVATDIDLELPKPVDTGTSDLATPLGGWTVDEYPEGLFAVRPGIYFPLAPTVDEPDEKTLKNERARGLGKRALYEAHQFVIDEWERGNRKGVEIVGAGRFVGIKSAVTYSKLQGVKRSKTYGEWIPHSTNVSFNPVPKREKIAADGEHLLPWRFFDWESLPYKAAVKSPEAQLLELAEQQAEEQPNADFIDLDVGEANG